MTQSITFNPKEPVDYKVGNNTFKNVIIQSNYKNPNSRTTTTNLKSKDAEIVVTQYPNNAISTTTSYYKPQTKILGGTPYSGILSVRTGTDGTKTYEIKGGTRITVSPGGDSVRVRKPKGPHNGFLQRLFRRSLSMV